MRGVFKVLGESEPPNEGACLRYMMNQNRQMRGRVSDIMMNQNRHNDDLDSPNDGA